MIRSNAESRRSMHVKQAPGTRIVLADGNQWMACPRPNGRAQTLHHG